MPWRHNKHPSWVRAPTLLLPHRTHKYNNTRDERRRTHAPGMLCGSIRTARGLLLFLSLGSLTHSPFEINIPPAWLLYVYGADAVSIDTAAQNLRPVPSKYRGKKWGCVCVMPSCDIERDAFSHDILSLPLAPFSEHATRDAEFAPLILSYFSVMRARRSMLWDYATPP
jgi:hypothetical protein